MINNRQGGRRRGRGGQRGQSLGGQPGNRQDNRQRGNAAQLLEKYKSMARDAQLAGDRVQTEYYLQYADHYFRVLSETRSRFEDQRRQRGDDVEAADDEDELTDSDEQSADDERPDRGERFSRPDRERERPRDRERARDDGGSRRRYSRDEQDSDENEGQAQLNGGETIPFDVLPPAIGASDEEADAPAARPRRKPRAARPASDDGDVAPAA